MSDTRKYRTLSAQQQQQQTETETETETETVIASLRDPRSMAELCREHQIADSLLGQVA